MPELTSAKQGNAGLEIDQLSKLIFVQGFGAVADDSNTAPTLGNDTPANTIHVRTRTNGDIVVWNGSSWVIPSISAITAATTAAIGSPFVTAITTASYPTNTGLIGGTPKDGLYAVSQNGTYTHFGNIVGNLSLGIQFIAVSQGQTVFTLITIPIVLTNYIQKTDVTTQPGKNKFDKATMIVTGKLVDPANGSILTAAGRSMTTPIPVVASTQYIVQGYGTIHNGIGIRFTNSSGTFISFVVSPSDVTSFTFTTPSTAAFVEMTIITGKASENTDVNNIMIAVGSTVSTYEAYKSYATAIIGAPVLPLEVLDPTTNASPISKGYADGKYLYNAVSVLSGKNLFDKAKAIPGFFVDGSNGNLVANAAFAVSAIIDVTPGAYTVSGGGSIHHAWGFRALNDSNTVINFGFCNASDAASGTFTVNAGATKVQFTYKTSKSGDNTDINIVQLEAGSTATSYAPAVYSIKTIGGSRVLGQAPLIPVAADDPISFNYYQNNSVSAPLSQIIGRNLFDKTKIIAGSYIDVTTGAIMTAAAYSISNVIPVQGGSTYTWSGLGSVHFALGVRITKADGTFDSVTSIPQDATSGSVVLPPAAAFIQFTAKTGKSGDNMDFNTLQVERGVDANPYLPAKYGILDLNSTVPLIATAVAPNLTSKDSPASKGDIDERVGNSSTVGKIMFTIGDSITRNDSITNWPTYAVPLLGVKLYNFAVSGASFTDFVGATTGQKMSEQTNSAIALGVTPDILVVALGTNDFQRPSLLGDYDTAMGKSIASLDRTLIIEAMRWNFYTIRNQWPNVKCFCALPLQRAKTNESTPPKVYEGYGKSLWLLDAISKMAKTYDFIVFDAAAECGVIMDYEVLGSPGRYLYDGLHPQTNGQILQGKYMAMKIKSNYVAS